MNAETRGLAANRLAAGSATTLDLVMLHGIYGRGRTGRPWRARLWRRVPRSGAGSGPAASRKLGARTSRRHRPRLGPGRAGLGRGESRFAAGRARALLRRESGAGDGRAASRRAAPGVGDRLDTRRWKTRRPAARGDMFQAVWPPCRERFAAREEAQDGLQAHGYDLPVAQWMTTNLVRDGERSAGTSISRPWSGCCTTSLPPASGRRSSATRSASRHPHRQGDEIATRSLTRHPGAHQARRRIARSPARARRRPLDSRRTSGRHHRAAARAPAALTPLSGDSPLSRIRIGDCPHLQ